MNFLSRIFVLSINNRLIFSASSSTFFHQFPKSRNRIYLHAVCSQLPFCPSTLYPQCAIASYIQLPHQHSSINSPNRGTVYAHAVCSQFPSRLRDRTPLFGKSAKNRTHHLESICTLWHSSIILPCRVTVHLHAAYSYHFVYPRYPTF